MHASQRLQQHPLTHVPYQRGWSMEWLARELCTAARRRGMIFASSQDRIYKWESGRVGAPDADYQMLLADVFGIDQDAVEILGWPWWLPVFDTRTNSAHTALAPPSERSWWS
ncbi:helix-turn-helix transcriptional regulator [Streptomyces sp. NPDC052701]|uniref:helix-turn-helix transcriptional regulator n=1 Tax=Streptomyces sp. NPDC052701 TaxID=3155533 RepID=UPI003412E21F